ncbi:MAG: hypothetical protein HZB91_02625 [Elusimicrobia bacterium]|nr:hypothetical protein [Elusimicrobiota bacterium]
MPVIAEIPTSRRGLIKTLTGSLLAWMASLPLISGISSAGASGPKAEVRLPRHSIRRERTDFKP